MPIITRINQETDDEFIFVGSESRETEMREADNQPETKELSNCCTLPLVINTAS